MLHLVEQTPCPEPWREVSSGQSAEQKIDVHFTHSIRFIEQRSLFVRQVLLTHCPEIVTAAEGFASHVTYIPVSAVGWETQVVDGTDGKRSLVIRPEDTAPYWVTVPFLYALCRTVPGLIPSIVRKKPVSRLRMGASMSHELLYTSAPGP